MSRVQVKPQLIQWAIDRAGLSVTALSDYFPKLELWIHRESQPTLRQVEDLAKKTMTPLGYFFLPEPPEDKLSISDFRTVKDAPVQRPSPNLLETIQTLQRRQNWLREYLIEEKERPLEFIGSAGLSSNPSNVAADIRHALGQTEDWARAVPTWTEALEKLSFFVERIGVLTVFNSVVGNNTHRKLNVNEFRGFVLADKYAPIIFVNSADAKAAQMFTLVHEVVHLWLGETGVLNLDKTMPADNKVEKFCNAVAAEFLVPERIMRENWPAVQQEDEPYQILARQFKVSPIVIARRALDLNFVDKHRFFDFYDRYLADERRKMGKRTGGGNFYATQDMRLSRRFAETVIRATQAGKLLYREAYHLTGLNGNTFDRYAKRLGFKAQE